MGPSLPTVPGRPQWTDGRRRRQSAGVEQAPPVKPPDRQIPSTLAARFILATQSPQCSKLRSIDVVQRGRAILAPMHLDCPALKVDLRPLEIAKLAGPHAVPEGNHDRRGVPVTVTVLLPGNDYQVADLGFRQVLPAPAERVILPAVRPGL